MSAEELVNRALPASSNITIRFPRMAEYGSDRVQNTTFADPSALCNRAPEESDLIKECIDTGNMAKFKSCSLCGKTQCLAKSVAYNLGQNRIAARTRGLRLHDRPTIMEAKLCDVFLQTGSQETAAHKNVLAAASKYFSCIFDGDDESASSEALILPDVNPTVFMQLIEFIYTGDIHISTDALQDILTVATIFQRTEVQRVCLDFLRQRLHPVNCLIVLRLAERLQDSDLFEASLLFSAQHFSLLEHSEDFLTLDSNLFTRLISSEAFNGLGDDRLKSIVCWAKHEATTRLTGASELLRYAQAPRLSKAYLQHLSRAKDEWECSPWLIEFQIPAHSGQLQISNNPISGPQRTRHLDYSDVSSRQTTTYRSLEPGTDNDPT
ncbi:hypothetical protein CRM22_006718 [Opisthorchis felineus]|uniref:BTB domain-containing protein n=1 Tax=Opisthorchis felineus TaxID=147828 RepID=A0A4S2LLG1_OPIFE|nr:hypothetical protein CRM22_006718 [Opisthorchis felineus]